jgi:ribosomal-protein-alanine N-acetyltransferase
MEAQPALGLPAPANRNAMNALSATDAMRADLPLLQGERLRLRGYRPEDFEDFYALHADPRVMRYWSFPAWTERNQAQARFRSALEGRDAAVRLCWAISARDDDRLIGGVTLFAIDRAHARAEIGYALAAAHWGHGYAAEALRLALAHAFGPLGLHRVEADIDPRNAASCRLVERLGFRREGLLRQRWHVAGEVCDSAVYGVLAGELRG